MWVAKTRNSFMAVSCHIQGYFCDNVMERCEISGSHDSEYEVESLLGCSTM